ncbi:P-loop NTPase family protein [Faecalicatena fissicatena]|uniref:Stage 0 sporulation protein A homolog n=1 Tax=Faecalicatena fissicatena TaxID=290055 RepID=A0ABS2E9Z6_9FIRM|nr:hypothetical protein [Faecalicatena fissicatena]MBM6738468.1 hypothetical protein [Faecalicatena fissicatena]HIX98339.1 hypothetical protein [Candidatus Dorea intestinigallinarum]
MSSRNLVICDPETEYAARLAGFLNGKRELAFQVKICKSPDQIQEAAGQMPIDILLISEDLRELYDLQGEGEKAAKTVLLTSERGEGKDMDTIFKYQSGEQICMCLMQLLARGEKAELLRIRKKGNGRIIGFYSPVRRLGQTRMALRKGRELSRTENVLYLNMEVYAGTGSYFPEERQKNMSELLYYAKQESRKLAGVLAGLVKSLEGVDYVPPAVIPDDIRDVSPGEWIWLFEEILRTSIYDTLVLDIGDSVQGLYRILEACDEIYMSAADDPAASSKIRQFEEALEQAGCGHVAERVVRCDIRRTAPGKGTGQTGSVKRDRRR